MVSDDEANQMAGEEDETMEDHSRAAPANSTSQASGWTGDQRHAWKEDEEDEGDEGEWAEDEDDGSWGVYRPAPAREVGSA